MTPAVTVELPAGPAPAPRPRVRGHRPARLGDWHEVVLAGLRARGVAFIDPLDHALAAELVRAGGGTSDPARDAAALTKSLRRTPGRLVRRAVVRTEVGSGRLCLAVRYHTPEAACRAGWVSRDDPRLDAAAARLGPARGGTRESACGRFRAVKTPAGWAALAAGPGRWGPAAAWAVAGVYATAGGAARRVARLAAAVAAGTAWEALLASLEDPPGAG